MDRAKPAHATGTDRATGTRLLLRSQLHVGGASDGPGRWPRAPDSFVVFFAECVCGVICIGTRITPQIIR